MVQFRANDRCRDVSPLFESSSSDSSQCVLVDKLFINRLPADATPEQIHSHFVRYGDCKVHIAVDQRTGVSKRYGYIDFFDQAAVELAVRDAPHIIAGVTVGLRVQSLGAGSERQQHKSGDVEAKKMFVGGLPPTMVEQELWDHFELFGRVLDCYIIYDERYRRSRGFGFVSFEDERLVEQFCAQHFIEIQGKQVECRLAEPKENPNALVNSEVRVMGFPQVPPRRTDEAPSQDCSSMMAPLPAPPVTPTLTLAPPPEVTKPRKHGNVVSPTQDTTMGQCHASKNLKTVPKPGSLTPGAQPTLAVGPMADNAQHQALPESHNIAQMESQAQTGLQGQLVQEKIEETRVSHEGVEKIKTVDQALEMAMKFQNLLNHFVAKLNVVSACYKDPMQMQMNQVHQQPQIFMLPPDQHANHQLSAMPMICQQQPMGPPSPDLGFLHSPNAFVHSPVQNPGLMQSPLPQLVLSPVSQFVYQF